MKYTLEITEKQAEIIKIALEEYFRLRMNQWFDFATNIALYGYEDDKSSKENGRKFNDYINRRNESQELFEKAFRTAQPSHQVKTDEMMIAEDIWQVIRQRLYLDRGGDPDGWAVDARDPLKTSDEPLPKMKGIRGQKKMTNLERLGYSKDEAADEVAVKMLLERIKNDVELSRFEASFPRYVELYRLMKEWLDAEV